MYLHNIFLLFVFFGIFSGCAVSGQNSANIVSKGTKIGSQVYDSFNEGATSYDEVIAKLGQPAERHEGITVDYRYEETSEKGKGFDAILGGVGKTRTVNECVTLVFDGKTKKLLQKRMTECDSKPSTLSTK